MKGTASSIITTFPRRTQFLATNMAPPTTSLITCIASALTHLDRCDRSDPSDTTVAAFQLKIELRNLKAQLAIAFLKLGPDLPSRVSGIGATVARILREELPYPFGCHNVDYTFKEWIYRDALPQVRGFTKQLADECCTSPLTVDDVVVIADSVLENVADFGDTMKLSVYEEKLVVPEFVKAEITDDFAVQVAFLKSLLLLATGTGVELQGLLILIQPFAINAARVFVADQHQLVGNWCKEVFFKCSAAISIATSPQVYEAYTQALSTSTIPSITPVGGILEDFLESLVSLLWDVLRHHSNSRVQDQLKVLYERLRFCRSILELIRGFRGEIRDRIGVLICGAGMLVCSLYHTQLELSYPDQLQDLLETLGVLQAQLQNPLESSAASESTTPATNELGSGDSPNIMEDIMISDGNEETATPGHQPQQSSSVPQVAGFQDDEVNPVLYRLTRGSKQLQIVPICGMAGVGKTTFASALYSHRSITCHFQYRAWCPISQVLDKRRVMLQLLNQKSEYYSEKMTDDDIANKLRQSLKGMRYLIVLDDVWTTEAWDSLAASFPDDSTQSRVIITSRQCDVAPGQQPHLLRLRGVNECLKILEMKLSHKKGWTSEFGIIIAKMCKGLPLTVVIVAGLLACTTKKQGWKGILDHLSYSGVSGENQCNNALELSFMHLPDDLKPCFLYLGAFPEDEEIYVNVLFRLWMGEGFVRESESGIKRIEDVAREYVENLIQRNLVMVARDRSIGGVKTCRIHDSIRDFCLSRVKQENFFHILSQRDDELSYFNEPPNLQRLIIHSDPAHFKEARLFCPRAHSMFLFSTAEFYLFDALFIIQIFKHLNVLDVRGQCYTRRIPSEIELLTQLRYLSIKSTMNVIPSSLGNLTNLETFFGIFWEPKVRPFPLTFWNLHKLKCVSIMGSGFSLPTENLENTFALLELETFGGVVFYSYNSMEQEMRKFPNIRRLKCTILPGREHSNKIMVSDFLNQIQCLTIYGSHRLQCEFGSSETLRKLSLDGFELSREEIADIGKLSNLEVLKLRDIGFWGDTLDMEEEGFPKLRYLKLVNIRINRWTVSDEQLPCLQKLILDNFYVLEELSSDCLKTRETIEEIQVHYCSHNVKDFAREIQETQKDYGNLVKVHISAEGREVEGTKHFFFEGRRNKA